MKSTIVRLLALILAMVMAVFAAGCGGEEVEIVYQYEDESQSASTDADTTSSSGNDAGTTSTGKKPSSKGDSLVNDNVNPADYRGTTITYATWRNPAQYEDGPVVKAFENKYGIKVKIDLMTETEYTNKVLANIGSGNAPDVYFSTYTFPYLAVLTKAEHTDELVKDGKTHLRIDYKVTGVGSAACGPGLPDAYKLNDKEIDFAFSINLG